MSDELYPVFAEEDLVTPKVTCRIIGHGTPRPWHDVSESFLERADAYCCKTKADIWIQRFDGKKTQSQIKSERPR